MIISLYLRSDPDISLAAIVNNLNYRIMQVRMLSRAANASDPKMWSSYVQANATTKAEIPSDPPQTTLGSFEVVSHELQRRSIYVYWKNLPNKHHNGPHFGYEVTEVLEANSKR